MSYISINSPQGKKCNLVMGYCSNYALSQIEPFFASLRRNVSNVHVVLFVAGMDSHFYHMSEKFDFTLYNARPYLELGYHGVVARYFMYDDYLTANAGKFGRVFITDIRDVIFQGDPFAQQLTTEVSFAAEDKNIGSCSTNISWLRHLYGEVTTKELSPFRISCSGTTIGLAHGVMNYVRIIRDECQTKNADWMWQGLDQGVHNFVLYKMKPDFCQLDESGLIVSTLHHTPEKDVQIVDSLIMTRGHAAPVVHQFDRHPAVNRFVQDTLRFSVEDET